MLFDGRPLAHVKSPRGDELRYKSTGELDGVFYTVV
jgi:hypothetical protein